MKLRKAIGAIILSTENEIIAFQRSDFKNNWQGPEGGCDKNEEYIDSLYREIQEEIGLDKKYYEVIKQTKEPIEYFFKEGFTRNSFNGQAKMFFLIKLKNKNQEFKYNTTNEKPEFLSYKKVKADELINLVPDFKNECYKKVLKEFNLL